MDSKIRIKDWNKFQHFKDRKPIWIKLYREIMDDVEWHELSGDSAKTLVMLWLLASESDGYLPDIKTISFRLRMSQASVTSSIKSLSHWLDISVISDVYHGDILETEKETEKKQRKSTRQEYPPQFDGLWQIYGLKGNKKAALKEWEKLTEDQKDDAVKAVPDYLLETPEKQFRKDFERYLSGQIWEGVLDRKANGCLNIPLTDRDRRNLEELGRL